MTDTPGQPDQPVNVTFDAVLERIAGRVGAQARDAALAEATRDALVEHNAALQARVDELEQQLAQATPQTVPARDTSDAGGITDDTGATS